MLKALVLVLGILIGSGEITQNEVEDILSDHLSQPQIECVKTTGLLSEFFEMSDEELQRLIGFCLLGR